MTLYVIYSSLILVIYDNMISGTNQIAEHVSVDISRSQGCKNATCQNEKIFCKPRKKREAQDTVR
jgi:hypothetical protein